MSNYHTHSIEDYQFTHGHHRIMSSGKYIALHPHFLGRPLTHEEMDFNLLYAEQTLAGFRIFGSNADLTLSDDDLGKSLLFHKIASNDDDFARYTAAGYAEGQYIWIPDCCGGTPIDCSTFQVSSITATATGGYSCGDFVVDSITATDSEGSDDCISFVVDNIVATDSEGSTSVPNPTPVPPTPTATEVPATPTATPIATAEVTATPTPTATVEVSATPEPTTDVRKRTLKLSKVINPWNEDPSARCDVDETIDYWAEWPIGTVSPGTGTYVSGTDGACYYVVAKYSYDYVLPEGVEINLTLIGGNYFTECDCGLPPTPTPTPTPTPNPAELSHLVYATEFNLDGEWWSTESYGPGVDPADSGQPRPVYVNQIYSDYYDNTDGSAVALTFGNELTQFNQPDNYAFWSMNSFVGWPESRWPERKAFKIQNISDLANFKYNYDSNVTEIPLSVTPKTGLAYLGEGIGQLEIGMPLYSSDASGRPSDLPETGAILVSQTEGGRYSSDPNQTWELPQGSLVDEVKDMQRFAQSANTLRYVIYENWVVKRVMNVAPGLPYGSNNGENSGYYPRLGFYDNRDWEELINNWHDANPTCHDDFYDVRFAVTNFIKDKLIAADIALPAHGILAAADEMRHTLYLYVNVYGGTLDTALLEEFKIDQGC